MATIIALLLDQFNHFDSTKPRYNSGSPAQRWAFGHIPRGGRTSWLHEIEFGRSTWRHGQCEGTVKFESPHSAARKTVKVVAMFGGNDVLLPYAASGRAKPPKH
jgi:hypothetical protein